MLGRGGQGIAGLWLNQRIDTPRPRQRDVPHRNRIQYMVVKQTTDPINTLEHESDMMYRLRNSDHIIRHATVGAISTLIHLFYQSTTISDQ